MAWLTSSEERVCNMLDCADGIMFDARVSRYRRRLQQSVKKHNAMQHFFADERRCAPISGRRNVRLQHSVLVRRWQSFFRQHQQGYREVCNIVKRFKVRVLFTTGL